MALVGAYYDFFSALRAGRRSDSEGGKKEHGGMG